MSRPDFAQKLLNDLKMRKERMAATQTSASSSIISADRYGGSRRGLKGSTDMKSVAKANSNPPRSSNRIENSSQMVPYSNQPPDLSMTLSYALDDNGKLKKMNLTGSSAMIGFLRQISSRSMDRSGTSQIQWPSSSQFPTLTSLHVDEVSRGAQRLNRVLQSFYNGVSSKGSSVDMGKELLKGAVELEESLRMLVSLQEASECMVGPKRRSRVKLLEIGEENDDGIDKAKSVERPVFSFDKRDKNEKVRSHRRSASSPVTSLSSPSSSQVKNRNGKAGISNVVAKLMGLDEIPKNEAKLRQSDRDLDGIVSQRMSFGDGDDWSFGSHSNNKIVILTSNNIESRQRLDERKPALSQSEKEHIMTHIMHLNKRGENEEEVKDRILLRKENGGVKRTLPRDTAKSLANLVQGKRVHKEKSSSQNELEKTSMSKEKSSRDGRIRHLRPPKRAENSKKEIKKAQEKDIHEVNISQEKIAVHEAKEESEKGPLKKEDVEIHKAVHSKKTVRSKCNKKVNEIMAKPGKSTSRPERARKQTATVLQGLKQRKPCVKPEAHNVISKTKQNVNFKLSCDQLNQPILAEKDAESKPELSELLHPSGKKQPLTLTNDEVHLKQILITSQVFLNTAEALFKLNIPIEVLNANDTVSKQEQDIKLTLDCAYEILKMKGKRRELGLARTGVRSLDDLVREIHEGLETVRSYGGRMGYENGQAEYLLRMVERDVECRDLDVNCMWDMGWKGSVFAYVERDEVVRGVEKCMVNELLDDALKGFFGFV